MSTMHRPNPILVRLGISRERVAAICARIDPRNGDVYDRAVSRLAEQRAARFEK